MYLHILWTDLFQENDAADILKQQHTLLSQLPEHDLEEAIIELSANIRGENYPHTYEMVITHEDIEKLRRIIEIEGTLIVYSGTGLDFKELLVSLYFVITHMNNSDDVLSFLKKLAMHMYDINQISARKIESIIRCIGRVCQL